MTKIRDFNMHSSTQRMREACKALAEDYLEEYPDYTLQDFFQSLLGEKTLNKKVIEEDFYYLSNGFYEAKGQNLEDAENKNEAKELYRLLFVAPKRIQEYLNSMEISEELPVTEEEKKEEKEKFEANSDETKVLKKSTNLKHNESKGLFENLSFFSVLSVPPFLLGILGIIIYEGRLFLCSLAGVESIDAETGEYIEVPWDLIGWSFAIGFGIIIVDTLFNKLIRAFKKK